MALTETQIAFYARMGWRIPRAEPTPAERAAHLAAGRRPWRDLEFEEQCEARGLMARGLLRKGADGRMEVVR